ncbi:MAG: GspH/FimT family pseudopilin [Cocleimonas sp.]
MIKKYHYKRKNTGFTLIEMIVAVAIVGIFASIAVPGFSGLLQSNRVSAGTNLLISGFYLAKNEALKRNNTITLCASTNQTSCTGGGDYSLGWIIFLDCDGDQQIGGGAVNCDGGAVADDSEVIIKVQDQVSGLYIDSPSGGSAVSFNYVGHASFAPQRVMYRVGVSSSDLRRNVFVRKIGRIRTVDRS